MLFVSSSINMYIVHTLTIFLDIFDVFYWVKWGTSEFVGEHLYKYIYNVCT